MTNTERKLLAARILTLLQQGKSLKEVAKEMSLTPGKVADIFGMEYPELSVCSLKRSYARNQLKQAIEQCLSEGVVTVAKIAEKTGLSVPSVKHSLHMAKISVSQLQGKLKDRLDTAICQARKEEVISEEILSAKTGLSLSAIQQLLKLYKIKLPRIQREIEQEKRRRKFYADRGIPMVS